MSFYHQSILQKRIKSKKPPENVTELVTINETLNHKGTLEVGSFVTRDFNETLEPRGSESPINGTPISLYWILPYVKVRTHLT